MIKRQSNYELLRIFAMFLIVLHHFANHGVMQCYKGPDYSTLWLSGSQLNQFFSYLFFPGGEVGVALFFMISGYFLIKSDSIKLKKVVLQTFFYSWLSVFVFLVVHFCCERYFHFENPYVFIDLEKVKLETIYGLLAPLRSGQYWFVSAYIVLILAKPLYNIFLNKLSKKGYIGFLLVLWLFGLVFARNYVLGLGYTQAFFYYAIGGYLKMHSTDSQIKYGGWAKFLIVLSTLVMWFLYAILRYGNMAKMITGPFNKLSFLFCSCCLVVLISICIFKFFAHLNIGCHKWVNEIGATTFGIYLLHEGVFIRPIIWDKIFGVYPYLYQQPLFPLLALLVAVAVFSCCSLIEYCRNALFVPVDKKIDVFLEKLKEKFFIREENA